MLVFMREIQKTQMNTTCATHRDDIWTARQGNLFLQAPDTDLSEFLLETAEFAGRHPKIIAKIDRELDAAALGKKRMRIADRRFLEARTEALPGITPSAETPDPGQLTLEDGRPRMVAGLAFMFLMLRGFLGNLTSAASRRILEESMSLRILVENEGLDSMPAPNTITSHLNNLSLSLREDIHDAQIRDFLREGLDDFKDLTLDSTSVFANSEWPTDGKTVVGLVARTLRTGRVFGKLGFPAFRQWHVPTWIEEMSALEFNICLSAGKAHSRRKMKRLYGKLFAKVRKASARLEIEFKHCMEGSDPQLLAPSLRRTFRLAVGRMRRDMKDIGRVVEYSENRVMRGEKLSSKEKILSLSDGSAAYIKKGGREAAIGYKPQICRSRNGFIPALKVPQGNTADSAEFVPVMDGAIARTGVSPRTLSVDDGYSSKTGREHFAGDVDIVSISGSKGKKITPEDEWSSPGHREARRMRSAIESMMYTIKHGFEFGRLGRRGIGAVRCELTEKVLAYNFYRAVLIRKRLAAERMQRAA